MVQLITERFSGLRKGTANFNAAIWPRLSQIDQIEIKQLISQAKGNLADLNGRSLVHQLIDPIEYNGGTIRSVRLKGILPRVDEQGNIPPHKGLGRNGYVPHPFFTGENGEVAIRDNNPGSPQGGLRAEKAEREFNVAVSAPAGVADFPFCFGEYDDLTYLQQPLGFVGFGQEAVEDLRFYHHYIFPLIDAYKDIDCGSIYSLLKINSLVNISYLFGQAMAKFHGNLASSNESKARLFAHSYPHFDNLGISASEDEIVSVRLRDFEDCKPLWKSPPRQAYACLFLDLSRIIFDYSSNRKADSGDYFVDFNLAHLLPYFFQGYFGSQLQAQSSYYPGSTKNEEAVSILLMNNIRETISGGQPVNLPDTLAQSPLGFIKLLHQTFSRLSGLS